jgi:hypothetical protein
MMTVRRTKKFNVINFQKWSSLFNKTCHYVAIYQEFVDSSKWSSISFSHWQCSSDGDFSFPRVVGLLMQNLWLEYWFELVWVKQQYLSLFLFWSRYMFSENVYVCRVSNMFIIHFKCHMKECAILPRYQRQLKWLVFVPLLELIHYTVE